jgi:ribosomal protein S18 acetylase RimI-like enzyme
MDVLIRRARRSELAAVSTLTVQVYGDEGLASDAYLPVLADTASRAEAPLTEVVVAVQPDPGPAPDPVQGSFTYCRFGSPFADLAIEEEAEIRMLAVRAAARRRGVGEAMVRHAVELARGHGCRRLVLFTMTVMPDARRLYERIGFGRVPDRDAVLRTGSPLLAYVLPLDAQ